MTFFAQRSLFDWSASARARLSKKGGEQLQGIDLNRNGKAAKFNDIDPPLPVLDQRNRRLISTKPLSRRSLTAGWKV